MRKAVLSRAGVDSRALFPLWLKTVATLFLGVFVVAHWRNSGPINFLWLSDIGLIGTVLALWLRSRLIASMMLLATFVTDGLGWNLDFILGLSTGWHPLNATTYMFDARIPLLIRILSLFHPLVPAGLVWMVYWLGYDRRALAAQTALTWIVLPVSYLLTDPVRNLNWILGPGRPQSYIPGWLYLAVMMAFVPLGFYLPVHLILTWMKWDVGRTGALRTGSRLHPKGS
ncbi:MAG TPA: membrane-associated protein [Candidatus Polarisedimenticolia bacterium]|jgi:hypothetical protein|nr:membrane-associated protein [Candidatus Polarisedimenticolia bacterium]